MGRFIRFLFILIFYYHGITNFLWAQSPDVFSPAFQAGKSEGQINQAVIAYWEQYFQENYFDKGYQPADMGGTGYKPFMRAKWFYDMRKNHQGEIPPLQRWEAYEAGKKHLLKENQSLFTANWESLGPNTIDTLGGRMLCHAFGPIDPNVIWAGSGSGGLWRTDDGGDNWISVTDNIPDLRVSSVAVNPLNPDEILIGTGIGVNTTLNLRPGVGVLRSTDRGLTWQLTNFAYQQTQGVSTYELLWDAAKPGRVFLAATNGLWFSDNNGLNWSQTALQNHVSDIVINKKDGNILYAAMRNGGIYKSTDGGNNWTLLSNGLPPGSSVHLTSLAICDSFPNVLYTGISQPNTWQLQGFYKTTDGGDSWVRLNNTPSVVCQPGSATNCQGWFVNITAVSPVDPDLVFFGGVQFWRSTNGGQSWTWHDYLSNGTGGGNAGLVYVDQWDIGFHPTDPNTIYVFNDGGVQKSTNGGLWWERKNNNLVTAQLYRAASSLLDPRFLVGGFQDHGLQRVINTDESLLWKRMTTFDGAVCIVDPTDDNILFVDWNGGTHWKSLNRGETVFQIMNGINEGGPWITPLVMDPQNPNVLFTAGNTKLYKTTNGGLFWSAAANIPSVNTIAVDQVDNNYVYAHAYDNSNWWLWRSLDNGQTWEQIPDNGLTNIPSWRVTDIEADPNQAGVVYATRNSAFSNRDHVKKSTDYGQTWVDITNNLPDVPTNAIAISPFNSNHIYLATDLGVYLSTDAGQAWQEFNDGLPLVYAFDIHILPSDSTVRIATSGRGVWKSRLAGLPVGIHGADGNEIPATFEMQQNYPNPFNPETTIPYKLEKNSFISAKIYNELGQEVVELYRGMQTAGKHSLKWNGRNKYRQPVASGNYFLRLISGGIAKTLKLTLVQ